MIAVRWRFQGDLTLDQLRSEALRWVQSQEAFQQYVRLRERFVRNNRHFGVLSRSLARMGRRGTSRP
ncbi:hypothetical protein JCM13580A_47030 [Streptomyces drozdowiczii]